MASSPQQPSPHVKNVVCFKWRPYIMYEEQPMLCVQKPKLQTPAPCWTHSIVHIAKSVGCFYCRFVRWSGGSFWPSCKLIGAQKRPKPTVPHTEYVSSLWRRRQRMVSSEATPLHPTASLSRSVSRLIPYISKHIYHNTQCI